MTDGGIAANAHSDSFQPAMAIAKTGGAVTSPSVSRSTTVHKSLGATLKKGTVILSRNPAGTSDFKPQQVFVALSRSGQPGQLVRAQPDKHAPFLKPSIRQLTTDAAFSPTVPGCGDNQLSDWQALREWVARNAADPSFVGTFRNIMLHNHMIGLYTSETRQKLATTYRARTRDRWSEDDKKN